jgi:hypothetical protein
MAIKVCMLSYTHQLKDDRIYWKESLSLIRNGYEVTHIAIGENDSDTYSEDGVRLIEVKKKVVLNSLF